MISVKLQILLVITSVWLSVYSESLQSDKVAKMLEYTFNREDNGNYYYRFLTTNGMTREETGTIVNEGSPDQYISVEGSYSYTNSDGEIETVNYKADKNGFVTFKPPAEEPVLETEGISENLVASLLG